MNTEELDKLIADTEEELRQSRRREIAYQMHWDINELPKLQREYTPKLVSDAIKARIDFASKKMLEQEEQYAALMHKPYSERKKVFEGKYALMKRMKTRYEALLKKHTVAPLPEWLVYHEYSEVKRLGLPQFIVYNLDYFLL